MRVVAVNMFNGRSVTRPSESPNPSTLWVTGVASPLSGDILLSFFLHDRPSHLLRIRGPSSDY